MRRGILIALLVPAVAFAGPRRKRKKKKAAPPPVEHKQTEPADAEPAPTPDAPATPTDAGTATPGTQPVPPSTFTPKPGAQPTVPPTLTTKSGSPSMPAPQPAATGTQPVPAPDTRSDEPPQGKEVDVDSLRQEYLALRDELFKSRARANAVASQLYSTRVTIKLTWGSARHYAVSKASIRLDGATVYEDATGAIAGDDGVRFTGFVAPGRHLVTFHLEAAGKDDDSFTSSTESQIVVKAVTNKDLLISAKGRDSGDIAYEWKRSEKGSYGLGIDVAVKATDGAKQK